MNTQIEVITPEQKEKIVQETKGLVVRAQELVIITEQDNTAAANMTAAYKAEIKKRKKMDLYTLAEDSKRAAAASFKALTELMIDPLDEAVEIITAKIGVFYKAETARRAELQRAEDIKAAALQAKEDAKAAAAQAKADADYAAKCAKAEAAGKAAPIAPAYVAPPVIIAPRVIAAVSAPAGTTFTKLYSAKVINLCELCLAVAEGREPEALVAAVMPVLNNRAKESKKEGTYVAPGVIVVMTNSTSQRT